MWRLAMVRVGDVTITATWYMGKELITCSMTLVTERLSMRREGRCMTFSDPYRQDLVRRQMHAAVGYVQLTGSVAGFPEFDPFID